MSVHLKPSAREDWHTPRWIWEWAQSRYSLEIDAAATDDNALLPDYWTRATNALWQDWRGKRIWCNPPYDYRSLLSFIGKGVHAIEADSKTVVVYLVPVKSDQEWWHRYVIEQAEIHWIRGRVHFDDGPEGSPFAVCILVYGQTVAIPGRQFSLCKPRSHASQYTYQLGLEDQCFLR